MVHHHGSENNTPSGQTTVKPTALGPVAITDTKLLIYGLFQKGRVLAEDGVASLPSGLTLANQRTVRIRFARDSMPPPSAAGVNPAQRPAVSPLRGSRGCRPESATRCADNIACSR